jgi:hypothetical protein
MDFLRLKNNMIDVIREEQIKLGYRSETVRLYYPLQSLNRFLEGDFHIEEMMDVLSEYCDAVREELGSIEVSNVGERFCFKIPPQGVDYIHDNAGDNEFIAGLIRTVSTHGSSMDDVLALFHRYSDHVHVERTTHGEFDYLVYFEDGKPDAYRYCLTDEGCHIIYHRFTKDDYEDFNF